MQRWRQPVLYLDEGPLAAVGEQGVGRLLHGVVGHGIQVERPGGNCYQTILVLVGHQQVDALFTGHRVPIQ